MRTTNTFGIQFITRTNKIKDGLADLCQSYAVTSELSPLQPFLATPNEVQVEVKIINDTDRVDKSHPVSCFARRYGRDWMIVVINETDTYQMGVVIENLKYLNGMKLVELYASEEVTVTNEEVVLRVKPREVKVLATGRKWETSRTKWRDYPGK